MPYEPVIPEGQHLGFSRTEEGAYVGHLFSDDANELMGHAVWREVEDVEYDDDSSYADPWQPEPQRELTPEERAAAEALAVAILIGILAAVEAARPHIMRWWTETVVPKAKSGWKAMRSAAARSRLTSKRQSVDEQMEFSHDDVSPPAPGSSIVIVDPAFSMSIGEWESRFRAMVSAGRFRDEQARILSRARIVAVGAELDSTKDSQAMTPQQFASSVMRMIEANPALLNDETTAEFARVVSRQQPGS